MKRLPQRELWKTAFLPRTTKVQRIRIQKNQVFEPSRVDYCGAKPDEEPSSS